MALDYEAGPASSEGDCIKGHIIPVPFSVIQGRIIRGDIFTVCSLL